MRQIRTQQILSDTSQSDVDQLELSGLTVWLLAFLGLRFRLGRGEVEREAERLGNARGRRHDLRRSHDGRDSDQEALDVLER